MSYQTQFEGPIWRVTFFGALTRDDILKALEDLIAAERGIKTMPPRITDMSRVTDIQVRSEHMMTSARARRVIKFANSFKSAIIAPESNQLGFARMFQILNDNPQIKIEIFSDETSALAWIQDGKADE